MITAVRVSFDLAELGLYTGAVALAAGLFVGLVVAWVRR
jgi:hypothetical protein